MARTSRPPWVDGPDEILRHAFELLQDDSDSRRRLAMIMVDNAVELALQTYLSLPKRVVKSTPTRKDYEEISRSFPLLVGAIEKYARDRVRGLDLGEIEWFHQLRNELYHRGNGLTIGREKVEVYAQLARLLFESLFDVSFSMPERKRAHLIGEFLAEWIRLESGVVSVAQDNSLLGEKRRGILEAGVFLSGTGLVSKEDVRELERLRKMRNAIVHGELHSAEILTPAVIARIRQLKKQFAEGDNEG